MKISPTTESSPLEGYLWKLKQNKRPFTPSWVKRFFCVCRDELHYYDCEKRLELKQHISLFDIKGVRKIRAGVPDVFSFEIVVNSNDESSNLVLRARTREDAERWIRGLSSQIAWWREASMKGSESGGVPKKMKRRSCDKYAEAIEALDRNIEELDKIAAATNAPTPVSSFRVARSLPSGNDVVSRSYSRPDDDYHKASLSLNRTRNNDTYSGSQNRMMDSSSGGHGPFGDAVPSCDRESSIASIGDLSTLSLGEFIFKPEQLRRRNSRSAWITNEGKPEDDPLSSSRPSTSGQSDQSRISQRSDDNGFSASLIYEDIRTFRRTPNASYTSNDVFLTEDFDM